MTSIFRAKHIIRQFNLNSASVYIHVVLLWDVGQSPGKEQSVESILKDEFFVTTNKDGETIRHDIDLTGFYSDIETVLTEHGLHVLRSDIHGMATVRLHPQTVLIPSAICAGLPSLDAAQDASVYVSSYLSSILIDGWRVCVGVLVDRHVEDHKLVATVLPVGQYTDEATQILATMVDGLNLDDITDYSLLHQWVYASPALSRGDKGRSSVVVMRGDDVVGPLSYYTSLDVARVVTLLPMKDMVVHKYDYIMYTPPQGHLSN